MWRADSFEKTLMLGKIEGRRRSGRQRMRWLVGITDSMDTCLGGLGSWWWTGRPGMLPFMGSQRVRHDWTTELNWYLSSIFVKSDINRKFGLGVQNEAGQRLTEFCQENALVIANILFQQHKRRFYTWTSPVGQYQNQVDYILFSQRWKSSI